MFIKDQTIQDIDKKEKPTPRYSDDSVNLELVPLSFEPKQVRDQV